MHSYCFERALFVVGEPNSGKSNQLRSMFRDIRLGTGGNIPSGRRLDEVYRLSNERSLYLRLTSPHEAGESLGKKRTKKNVDRVSRGSFGMGVYTAPENKAALSHSPYFALMFVDPT